MVVTATEFKTNLGKYFDVVKDEEVIITKNGHKVAKLVPAKESITDSLVGILKDVELPENFDGDYRKWIREMRYRDYENTGRY